MDPYKVLESFFKKYFDFPYSQPFLLALSGGADSLCLFYCLLDFKKKFKNMDFHVAHVDHGWRQESFHEAEALKQLVESMGIPFHLKRLELAKTTGNLENFCREERFSFFRDLSKTYSFQAVLLAHHADDQAETILKRLLEGSHWSSLKGLQSEIRLNNLLLLRPFLSVKKKDIRLWLLNHDLTPFEDRTNEDVQFLRARMRKVLLPELNKQFGKNVENSLNYIGEEVVELIDYFNQKIESFLNLVIQGPFGVYLNLQDKMPQSLLEIKYLIRRFCELKQFYLSRPLLKLAAELLQTGAANKRLEMGNQTLLIDRNRLFIPSFSDFQFQEVLIFEEATIIQDQWIIRIEDSKEQTNFSLNSWESSWKGQFKVILPKGEYRLALAEASATFSFKKCSIGKWWENHKVPAFLRKIIPVIWYQDTIYYEFLTGKQFNPDKNSGKWIEVCLELK